MGKRQRTRSEEYKFLGDEMCQTPQGIKYRAVQGTESRYGRVYVDFGINLEKLFLFEEFCNNTGRDVLSILVGAIFEKMDREIKESQVEQIGNFVKDKYMKKWFARDVFDFQSVNE